MATSPARHSSPSTSGGLLYGMYVGALASALLGNLVIRVGAQGGWLPQAGTTVLAAMSVLPLLVAAFLFWRMLRSELDEMLQRIVLEGMAMGLIVYVPLAALYTNLRTAGAHVPRLDPPDVLFGPAVLVALGIAIAARRYR